MKTKIFRSTVTGFGRGRFLIAFNGNWIRALQDHREGRMQAFPIESLNMGVVIGLKVKRVS